MLLIAAAALTSCSKTPAAPSPAGENTQQTITITGIVYDLRSSYVPSGNYVPVPGALVEVVYKTGAAVSTTASADGAFRIDGVLTVDSFELRASKDGYKTGAQTMLPPAADARIDVGLEPIRLILTGVITETSPTDNIPVAGAVIEILTGSNKGKNAVTDGNGAYALRDVWGEFDVSVSSPNHETRVAHAAVERTPRLDVRLPPRNIRTRTTFTGGLCTTVRLMPYQSCTQPFEREHEILLQRPGTVTVSLDYQYVGDYHLNHLTLDVRCGSVVILEKRFTKLWEYQPTVDGVPGPLQMTLDRACLYEFRVSNFIADTKGGHQTTYRIDIDHPR
jgi:hypothetical protein